METLYDRIRSLRIEKNLSQDELARLTGYTSRSSVNKIESGLIDISIGKLARFAKALDTTPGYLLDGNSPIVKESYSDKEKEMIRKYRELSPAGKATVDAVLDIQYQASHPVTKKETC